MAALSDLQQRIIRMAADQAAGQFRLSPDGGPVAVGSTSFPADDVAEAVNGLVDEDLLMKVGKGLFELTGDGWIRATKIVL